MLVRPARSGEELLGQQDEAERCQREPGESLGALADPLAEAATEPQSELGDDQRLHGDQRDHEPGRDVQQAEP
jgi:hypothetical protein